MNGFRINYTGFNSNLNTGNGTEGAMVCTSLGSLLRPLFYFLCSNLKANPVAGEWRLWYALEFWSQNEFKITILSMSKCIALVFGVLLRRRRTTFYRENNETKSCTLSISAQFTKFSTNSSEQQRRFPRKWQMARVVWVEEGERLEAELERRPSSGFACIAECQLCSS